MRKTTLRLRSRPQRSSPGLSHFRRSVGSLLRWVSGFFLKGVVVVLQELLVFCVSLALSNRELPTLRRVGRVRLEASRDASDGLRALDLRFLRFQSL